MDCSTAVTACNNAFGTIEKELFILLAMCIDPRGAEKSWPACGAPRPGASVLLDWEWFAALTRLGKPVEMIMLEDGEHIMQKPWDRIVSQHGNVDWFCFWLKAEEDPDPAKSDQYTRWRELRSLQDTASTKRPN